MRYFVPSGVIGCAVVVIAFAKYVRWCMKSARRRIRCHVLSKRAETTTQILPTTILPSFLPSDEATVSTPLSAFDASRAVDDNLTVVLACVRPSLADMRWCRCPACHSLLFTKRHYCSLDNATFEEIPECILSELARDRSILAKRLGVRSDSQVIALLYHRYRYQFGDWAQDGDDRCEVVG